MGARSGARPDARSAVLAALRRCAGPPEAPPELAIDAVRYDDPAGRFAESVERAGGRCVMVRDEADLERALRGLPAFAASRRVWSALPGLGFDDRAAPADLDLAVLAGAPAVAESGAVFLAPESRREREAAFLAQHLALVTPRASLVHELHEAYARIDPAASAFACFVAGPSKTADIEQALVIGAHGPRSLTVLLVGDGA